MKQVLIAFFIFFAVVNGFAQQGIDPATRDFIERQTLKNIYLFNLQSSGSRLKDLLRSGKYWDHESATIQRSVPPFGFSIKPDIVISKFEKAYPVSGFQLYKVQIPRGSKINDSLFHRYSSMMGEYLVGINEQKEIKFIGGNFFKHHLVGDFKFKKNRPESYIYFLELSYFDMEHDGIRYVGKKGAHYVYEGTSRNPFFVKFTLELDPENPEKTRHNIVNSEDQSTWYRLDKRLVVFHTKEQAEELPAGRGNEEYLHPQIENHTGCLEFSRSEFELFQGSERPYQCVITGLR